MTPRKVAIFITVDLVFLLGLLLYFSYYGLSHLIMLLLGLGFLFISIYDLRTKILSQLFSDFLNLSGPEELGNMRWLPVVLSALLLFLSLPVALEHGLVNTAQRWAMQEGQFARVAIPAIAGGIIVITLALWTLFKGVKEKENDHD